jgi:hypothetical protein
MTFQEKLKQAKEKLQEFYTEYPQLNPVNPQKIHEIAMLSESYNSIIDLLP